MSNDERWRNKSSVSQLIVGCPDSWLPWCDADISTRSRSNRHFSSRVEDLFREYSKVEECIRNMITAASGDDSIKTDVPTIMIFYVVLYLL